MFPIIGGWQLSFPDAQGVRTDYTLDNLGQTTSETIGGTLVGDVLTGGETTIYDYNAFGDLVNTTDPSSHKSTNIVDSVGRVYRTIQPNPDGSSTPLVEDHQPDPTTGSNYGWVNYTDGGYGNSYYKGDSASQPAVWTFSTTGKANRQFLVLASIGSKGSFTAWDGSNTQLTWNGDSTAAAKSVSGDSINAQNDDAYWQVVGVVTADANGVITIKLAAGAGAVADGIYLLETMPQTYYAYDAIGNQIAVTDALGQPLTLNRCSVVASNPQVHEAMLAITRSHYPQAVGTDRVRP